MSAGFHQSVIASGTAPLPVVVPASDKPLPVPYQQAVRAITACTTIDEAKHWGNAADALAAWARIYGDDSVAREARQLKLHAYRRIGILAKQVGPLESTTGMGRTPGPRTAMLRAGLSNHQADAAAKLAAVPNGEFKAMTQAARPPSPLTLASIHLRKNPLVAACRHGLASALGRLRKPSHQAAVLELTGDEADRFIAAAEELEGILRILVKRLKVRRGDA